MFSFPYFIQSVTLPFSSTSTLYRPILKGRAEALLNDIIGTESPFSSKWKGKEGEKDDVGAGLEKKPSLKGKRGTLKNTERREKKRERKKSHGSDGGEASDEDEGHETKPTRGKKKEENAAVSKNSSSKKNEGGDANRKKERKKDDGSDDDDYDDDEEDAKEKKEKERGKNREKGNLSKDSKDRLTSTMKKKEGAEKMRGSHVHFHSLFFLFFLSSSPEEQPCFLSLFLSFFLSVSPLPPLSLSPSSRLSISLSIILSLSLCLSPKVIRSQLAEVPSHKRSSQNLS